MIIDGEKYACEACVRGHRVSSCSHSDRPLLHVNKKGRPVSQCQHCRGMRKNKSQHTHCECQQKGHVKDECPLGVADGKNEPGTCCCQHTAKCTCAHKKDHLQAVPEDVPHILQPKDQPRPRSAHMNSHDSKPTVFANGHHKPVHKLNDAHNHVGAPYYKDHHRSPSKTHILHNYKEIAQRSSDSLPLGTIAKPHHESPLHFSVTPEQTRQVKSEHNSPRLGPTQLSPNQIPGAFVMPAFDPNEYSYSPFPNTQPTQSNQPTANFDFSSMTFDPSWFVTYGEAQQRGPPNSISLLNMDSSDNLLLNHAALDNFQQTDFQSLDPFSRINVNPNPNISSTEISETDDYIPTPNRQSVPRTVSTAESTGVSSPESGLTPDHRLSSASSYYGSPKGTTFTGNATSDYDIDEVLRQTEAETRKMQLQGQHQPSAFPSAVPQISDDSQGFDLPMHKVSVASQASTVNVPMHPFTVHEAQQLAHLRDGAMDSGSQMSFTPTSAMNDPAWSMAPDMSNPELSLDDAQEDEDWVR